MKIKELQNDTNKLKEFIKKREAVLDKNTDENSSVIYSDYNNPDELVKAISSIIYEYTTGIENVSKSEVNKLEAYKAELEEKNKTITTLKKDIEKLQSNPNINIPNDKIILSATMFSKLVNLASVAESNEMVENNFTQALIDDVKHNRTELETIPIKPSNNTPHSECNCTKSNSRFENPKNLKMSNNIKKTADKRTESCEKSTQHIHQELQDFLNFLKI